MNAVNPRELLNEKQAAHSLGLPVRTLQQWRLQRRVLPFVKIGKCVRYDPAMIAQHIEKNTVRVSA